MSWITSGGMAYCSPATVIEPGSVVVGGRCSLRAPHARNPWTIGNGCPSPPSGVGETAGSWVCSQLAATIRSASRSDEAREREGVLNTSADAYSWQLSTVHLYGGSGDLAIP